MGVIFRDIQRLVLNEREQKRDLWTFVFRQKYFLKFKRQFAYFTYLSEISLNLPKQFGLFTWKMFLLFILSRSVNSHY